MLWYNTGCLCSAVPVEVHWWPLTFMLRQGQVQHIAEAVQLIHSCLFSSFILNSKCQWGQRCLYAHWHQLHPFLCPCKVPSLTLPRMSSWPVMFCFSPRALALLLTVSRCSTRCPTPPLVSFHHDVEFCCQHECLQLLLWVRKRWTALLNQLHCCLWYFLSALRHKQLGAPCSLVVYDWIIQS